MLAGSLFAMSAQAVTITLTVSPGIGLDVARTCKQASCLGTLGGQAWINNSNYAASGTITIDTVALTMSAALSVSFSEITGSADNGITEIEFNSTTYTFTNLPVTVSSLGGLTTYSISGNQTSVVDPSSVVEVGTGGGTTDPIFSAVKVLGSCGLVTDNTGQCGFTFGRTGFQAPAPLSRYVEQTFNLAVVPEPSTLALLALGALGLGWALRRLRA